MRLHVVTGKGGTGKTTVAAALGPRPRPRRAARCCSSRSRAGRASPGSSTARRSPTRSGRSPSARATRTTAATRAATCTRSPSTPRARSSTTCRCSTACAARASALTKLGMVDFATTIAPGLSRRPGHRQGHRGDPAQAGGHAERLRLRRGGPRRAADRPHRPVPQRHRRGLRPGQGRAGPVARRHRGQRDQVAADRRALRHAPWRRCPCRRPWTGSPRSGASRGMQVGGIIVNMSRPGACRARLELKAQPDLPAMAAALGSAGLYDTDGLAAALAEELSEHLRLDRAGRPRAHRARERLASRCTSCRWSPRGSTWPRCTSSRPSCASRERRRSRQRTGNREQQEIMSAENRPVWTSTGSSTTGAPGSSSAAARAVWARPPRRPRSGCAPPSAAARSCVLTVDPARRLAQSMGLTSLDNTPAAGGRHRRRGGRQPARDDAGHEAHLRRDRRGARRPGPGRADPGQPLLPVAVVQLRRDAGVHGDGEARPAAPVRRVGPDRGGHAAEPVGARLPRRAGAAGPVPRRAADQGADRAGEGGPRLRAGAQRRPVGDDRGADQAARRAGAARRPDVHHRLRHDVRRVPRARRRDLPAAPGARARRSW